MGERDNRVLLQKAAEIEVADFAAGGALVAEQADKFIVQAINKAVLLPMVTFHGLTSPQAAYPKMRFATRVLHAGAENTPLPSGSWAKPTFGQVTLNVKKFKSEARFDSDVLEDQIERGGFQKTFTDYLTSAIARDMEYYAINGDTASADPDLGQMNGWLKLAATNLVNVGGGTLTKLVFKDMMKQLDPAFRASMDFKFFTHTDAVSDYVDSLMDRQTSLGDAALLMDNPPVYKRRQVVEVPEFPIAAGTGYTQVLGTDPKGLHVGVLRKITLKVGEDLSADQVIITATVRYDVAVEEELAVSKAYAVATA